MLVRSKVVNEEIAELDKCVVALGVNCISIIYRDS